MAAKTKTATSDKVVKTLKSCLICSSEMKDSEFYKSRNTIIDDRYSVCKQCACREGNHSFDRMHKVLFLLNIPFLPELIKEVEGTDNMFSQYMLRINNPKKKYEDGRKLSELTYDDSPTLERVTDVDSYIYTTDEQMSDLKDIFGDWWKKEQLLAMNKELDKMFIEHGGDRSNLGMLDLYGEIITLKWLSRERFSHGDSKEGKALSETRQKLLKDNGMNVQALKEKKSNDSIGERIDWVEWEPIIPKKKYYDIDGIMFMWQKLIDQIARFVGVNKKPVDEDAKEMIEYVEKNKDTYCKDME